MNRGMIAYELQKFGIDIQADEIWAVDRDFSGEYTIIANTEHGFMEYKTDLENYANVRRS